MTSPMLNVLALTGCGLCYSGVVAWSLYGYADHYDPIFKLWCPLRSWLMTLGSSLLYGVLVVKVWRIYKIFRKTPNVKRVVVRDTALLLRLSLVLLADVTLLTLWQALDPLKSAPKSLQEMVYGTEEVTERSIVIMECTCLYAWLWASLLVLSKVLLLTGLLYLSWHTRMVNMPPINESGLLLSSVHVALLGACALMAAHGFLRQWPDVLHACSIGVISSIVFATQTIIFIPKVLLQWRGKSKWPSTRGLALQALCVPGNDAMKELQEELWLLQTQTNVMNKSLHQKEFVIKSLRNHIKTAKGKLENIVDDDEIDTSGLSINISDETTGNKDRSKQKRSLRIKVRRTKSVPGTCRTSKKRGKSATGRQAATFVNKRSSKRRKFSSQSKLSTPPSRTLFSRDSHLRVSLKDIALELDTANTIAVTPRKSLRDGMRIGNHDDEDGNQCLVSDEDMQLKATQRLEKAENVVRSIAESYRLEEELSVDNNVLVIPNCGVSTVNDRQSTDNVQMSSQLQRRLDEGLACAHHVFCNSNKLPFCNLCAATKEVDITHCSANLNNSNDLSLRNNSSLCGIKFPSTSTAKHICNTSACSSARGEHSLANPREQSHIATHANMFCPYGYYRGLNNNNHIPPTVLPLQHDTESTFV